MSDFDDENWCDLEKVLASAVQKPEVAISLKPAPRRYNPKIAPRVSAVIWLRRAADDERDVRIVDRQISKLRGKLKPLGIEIETIWGQGYRLDASAKARLRMFVDKARAA